jgi:hypothetical protein
MHRLATSVATVAVVSLIILVFTAALLSQNGVLELLVGLGSVIAALALIARSGPHA